VLVAFHKRNIITIKTGGIAMAKRKPPKLSDKEPTRAGIEAPPSPPAEKMRPADFSAFVDSE
jgi:hypothetical protein